MTRPLLPWEDAPLCPDAECGAPMTLEVNSAYAGSYEPGVRLVCCGCGVGYPGTDEEVAQAAAADAAWEVERAA